MIGREQYRRIVSAADHTLEQMREGPKNRGDKERVDAYERRVELWYQHKHKFVLFAVKCIREVDEQLATEYLNKLRRIRHEI